MASGHCVKYPVNYEQQPYFQLQSESIEASLFKEALVFLLLMNNYLNLQREPHAVWMF